MEHTVDDAPSVLATADLLAVDHDSLLGADDSEGNDALILVRPKSFADCATHTLMDVFNATSSLSCSSLSYGYILRLWNANSSFILSLNAARSSSVKLSLLAMTGTTLTNSLNFLSTTMSIGLRPWPEG